MGTRRRLLGCGKTRGEPRVSLLVGRPGQADVAQARAQSHLS